MGIYFVKGRDEAPVVNVFMYLKEYILLNFGGILSANQNVNRLMLRESKSVMWKENEYHVVVYAQVT